MKANQEAPNQEAPNQEAMDVFVMTELMRLERDHSRLEHLYRQLPNADSQPTIGERFFSLWSDVEKRAYRLEYILDHLAQEKVQWAAH